MPQTRVDRQTLLFSATWPQEVQAIASELLRDPIKASGASVWLSEAWVWLGREFGCHLSDTRVAHELSDLSE